MFRKQPLNGLHIKNYFFDTQDNELPRFTPFLKFLSNLSDVRPVSEWLQKFEKAGKFSYLSRRGQRLIYVRGDEEEIDTVDADANPI